MDETIENALNCLENADKKGFFTEMDTLTMPGHLRPVYARLKKEFVSGFMNVDFDDRLAVFAGQLGGKPRDKKTPPTTANDGTKKQGEMEDMIKQGTKGFILTAYANEGINSAEYLRALPTEFKGISKALEDGPFIEIPKPYCTTNDIFNIFNKNRGKIVAFHYAGHANYDNLLLETTSGSPEEVYNGGLARELSGQPGLRLIFLNGCCTSGFLKALIDNGCKAAVVATHKSIGDKVAADLAIYFYTALSQGLDPEKSLEQAFNRLNPKPDENLKRPIRPSEPENQEKNESDDLDAFHKIAKSNPKYPWGIWVPKGFVWEQVGKPIKNDDNNKENGMDKKGLKDKIIVLIESSIDDAFDELDGVFGKANGMYNDLSREYFSRPNNFDMATFRSKLKRFVKTNL